MKPYRIVLAGCGSMANEWVKVALGRMDCEIVGLLDILPENAAAMAQRHGLQAAVYTDLPSAINATCANLVFDVTIPSSHKDIAITAMRMGCDVFGEKPMASSLEEAAEMVRVAKETGKTYSVMQNRRYIRHGRALARAIQSGAIGTPGFITADFFLGPHFGGFRDVMESPLILDMAIHTFDQARAYSGCDPVSVYCQEFNPQGSWYQGNASAVCIFEMTNGCVFCYRGSWCAEGCGTSWDARWRVVGSQGSAEWDGPGEPVIEAVVPPAEPMFFHPIQRVEVTYDDAREGHAGCLDDMFLALSQGQKAPTDCEDNIKSVAMVFAAIQSAREGRKVPISY